MKGFNRAILLGNVGKDPEIRSSPKGTVIASVVLATSDREKVNGEWKDVTEWHNLVAFGSTAEVLRDYVKKGSSLFVEGKIRTRSWEDKKSGETKYRTEIIVDQMTLVGSNGKANEETKERVKRIKGTYPAYAQSGPEAQIADDDSDVPF